MRYDRIFLATRTEAQVHDVALLLQARGYTVYSALDAAGLLSYHELPENGRNACFVLTHTMLMAKVVVLHADLDAATASLFITRGRLMGLPVVHIDELPLLATDADQEHIDAIDLVYTETTLRERVREVVARVTNDINRAEQWLNKLLGDGLKNPMVREHQQAARINAQGNPG